MSFIMPPDYTRLGVVTNAVANTTTIHTLVPAPGAGRAFRVIHVGCSIQQNAAAGTIVKAIWADNTGGNDYLDLGVGIALNLADRHNLPYPGHQLVENRAIAVVSLASLAAVSIDIWAFYYTDILTP